MDNFDLRKYLAEGKLLKEETVVKEGLQVTTNDQLKKAVEDNKGSAAICKINSEQSPAPELEKLNGQFCIIENSMCFDDHCYAESVRMCKPEGADSFFITSDINKLPAVIRSQPNGCDFSYFELVAVVGVTTNPKKIKSQGGGYEDNPNFDANAKDVRQIVKKY